MNFFQENVYLIGYFWKKSNMHKAKNIYYLLIWKKNRDGPRQGTFPYLKHPKAFECFFFFFFFFFFITHTYKFFS